MLGIVRFRSLVASLRGKTLFSTQGTPSNFVPFRLTEDDALERFRSWAERQWLAPQAVRNVDYVHELRAVFLPFWTFDVTTKTKATASIGKKVWGVATDARGNVRPRLETIWSKKMFPQFLKSSYSRDLPEMQVYGSTTFKRASVQVLKLPLSTVERLSASVVHGQEVDTWTMHRTAAFERIIKQVRAAEMRHAEREFKRLYNVGSVRDIDLKMEFSYQWSRVYFPAFIIGYSHLGRHFRCFVNGFDGRIDGLPQFSAGKVAGAVALPTTLLLNLLVSSLSPTLWIVAVLLPACVLGAAARFWPVFQQGLREMKRLAEQKSEDGFRADEEQSDDQYSRESRAEWQRRYQQRMSHQNPSAEVAGRELYLRLGIAPSASLGEISRAFRAKALKWHPDVHSGAQDKQFAAKRFKSIVSAYKTLRDPVRRAEYDRTGRVPGHQ